jgi:perosamine synthetase
VDRYLSGIREGLGGLPGLIPLAKPWVGEEELRALGEVLRSRWLGQGERVREFERLFAEYVGTEFAVAVSSGTAALHLALLACGVGPGDEVILPTFTFPSTANAVLYAQAKPVFVDIEGRTYNMDPSKIEGAITDRTKAIIPVHYAGHPSEMGPIIEIAEARGLKLIEDSAEALGATYGGRKVGGFGDVGCFSFAWNKIVTTGEGGMLTTDCEGLARAFRSLREHGKAGPGSEEYSDALGYNYKMTNLQAAIGIVQLGRAEESIRRRIAAARYLSGRLGGLDGIITPVELGHVRHVYQMYTIAIEEELAGTSRDLVAEGLRSRGIECRVYFRPVHLLPLYRRLFGHGAGAFPIAERAYERVLSLPLFPEMRPEEADMVAEALRAILEGGGNGRAAGARD